MQVQISADWHYHGPRRVSVSDRFRTKVDREGPMPEWHPEYGQCWDWTASIGPNGYGQFGRGGRGNGAMGAHLAAWELASGDPVPEGLMIGHTCDRKICVRNDTSGMYVVNGKELPRFGHLWLGTLADNNADMHAKERCGWQLDPEGFRRTLSKPRSHRYNVGTSHMQAKLTDVLVMEILSRFVAGGISKAALGRAYGVSEVLIGFIVRRTRWTHVQWPQ